MDSLKELSEILDRFSAEKSRPPPALDASTIERLARLYRELGAESAKRHEALARLASDGGHDALATFADLVASDPPRRAAEADRAFVPLFRTRTLACHALFPRLLDAIADPAVAPLVLDLANYLTASGKLPRHPAADRVSELAALLGSLALRLERLVELPPPDDEAAGREPEQEERDGDRRSTMVHQSVALVVSLCRALALIGEVSVVGKVRQSLGLRHRRLQVEAASALGQLGDPAGIEALVRLAAEPSVRPWALAYLEELHALDRCDEAFRTPVARAEGDLASWLAERAQFGIAPQAIEPLDSRRQYWPGFDEPVDCHLFRYEYRLPGLELAGVGIAAPVLHTFRVDWRDWNPEDIYAAFAGWNAEHPEIEERTAADFEADDRAAFREAAGQLAGHGYERVEPVLIGRFFGDRVYVAAAVLSGERGTVILESGQPHWFPCGNARQPLGPEEAYLVFKGRKLMAAFNPPDVANRP